MSNVDPQELSKFGELAHRWWDRNSEFRPLHDMNPLRLEWIDTLAGLAGKRVLDIGCGGGILSEAMAGRAEHVTGIDLATKALGVARLHAMESGVENIEYREVAAETLAAEAPHRFDLVTCMEMLEHVPDPASIVAACAKAAAPGATLVFATLNRNPKSYAFAILGAEYLLRLLPRGTHDWTKFVRPAELARHARRAGLDLVATHGMTYNPLTRVYRLEPDTSVNYLAAFRKPARDG